MRQQDLVPTGDRRRVATRHRTVAALAAAVLAVHAVLLAYGAYKHSPVLEEYWHLLAGVSHWEFGRFDLFRVNPPLVRTVGAIPVVIAGYEMDWSLYEAPDGTRPEQWMRDTFVRLNGARIFWLATIARWACIPFSVLGGWACYLFASKLFGPKASLMAVTLWCFSPNILGHGQLVSADIGAAAMGVAAHYAFWRYLASPNMPRAIGSGTMLGLALLTKSTWVVVLPPIWLGFWLVRRLSISQKKLDQSAVEKVPGLPDQLGAGARSSLRWGDLFTVFLLAWYVLNLGYLFEGTFTPLGEYGFISETLGGKPEAIGMSEHVPRNPYRDSWLAYVPVPLPKNFVAGIDIQKRDFERGWWSYLRGEWRYGGWWYYYLYAMAIKMPLGLWGLAAVAVAVRRYFGGPGRFDELFLAAPAVAVVALVSSQTGFGHHLRYVLPAFPFLFISISRSALALQLPSRVVPSDQIRAASPEIAVAVPNTTHKSANRHFKAIIGPAVVLALVTWFVGSSLYYYPHGISYFNELIGGPANGWRHLAESNTDWGQDLLYLKQWYDDHPQARPIAITYRNDFVPQEIIGIDAPRPPAGLPVNADPALPPPRSYGPLPGWYILSANKLNERGDAYRYFGYMTPVDRIGYSMNVYHVTVDEANRVRRLLGWRKLE